MAFLYNAGQNWRCRGVGGVHDGIVSASMVRSSRTPAKSINVPINQTEYVEYDKFLEFVL